MARTNRSKGIDSVGWGFWSICFGVLVVPCTLLSWIVSYEDARSRFLPYLLGVVLAALGAGFLSWFVNAVIQKRLAKKRKTERKKSKKRK